MALVQGEDSESDEEEINTDQLGEGSLGYAGAKPDSHKAGIVSGEESETDEEGEPPGGPGVEQTDSAPRLLAVPPGGSPSGSASPRRTSRDPSPVPAPPSLLHKKLRETNVSLRRNLVDRILRMYHTICRNLTLVNDNLTRAQGTIEKVNAHLKRSDNELAQLNSTLEAISREAGSFAPTIRLDITRGTSHPRLTTPSSIVSSDESTPDVASQVAHDSS